MTSPTVIVAYLALFTGVGIVFLLANLAVGYLLRPKAPNKEKLEVYECGEPTIGSSFVQFDLRFYVVALLFIIFDVEVALFFPWATVFGKATQLMDPQLAVAEAADSVPTPPGALTLAEAGLYRELGVVDPSVPALPGDLPAEALAGMSAFAQDRLAVQHAAWNLAVVSFLDILVFFAVLMVGFFYVWKRGDLDWVRAISRERAVRADRAPPVVEEEPALSV